MRREAFVFIEKNVCVCVCVVCCREEIRSDETVQTLKHMGDAIFHFRIHVK